jgi:hypothetical protein
VKKTRPTILELARKAVEDKKDLLRMAKMVVAGLRVELRTAELRVLAIKRDEDELCYRCHEMKSKHGLEHRYDLNPKCLHKPIRCLNCKKVLYDPRTGLIPVVGPCGVSKAKCKGFSNDPHVVCKETGHACDQYCPNA